MELDTENMVLDAEETKAASNGTAADKILLIVFKLGTEEYGLPIDQIKEVVLTPRISQIPQTPHYIKGVANIRGNVISIVDLEDRFGLIAKNGTKSVPEEIALDDLADEENSNYTLVIESEEYSIGILVKEVPNTLSVSRNEIDSTSNIIQHSSLDENAINGIVKLDDRMIIMINILSMMDSGGIQTSVN
jgi:purine-binding chemotaxis protein CheW